MDDIDFNFNLDDFQAEFLKEIEEEKETEISPENTKLPAEVVPEKPEVVPEKPEAAPSPYAEHAVVSAEADKKEEPKANGYIVGVEKETKATETIDEPKGLIFDERSTETVEEPKGLILDEKVADTVEEPKGLIFDERAADTIEEPKSKGKKNKKQEAEDENPKQKSKAWSVFSNILFVLFIVIVLGGSIMFAMSNSADKSIFGYRIYNVLTKSMEPELNQGDLIFTQLVDPDTIEVGDAITFFPGNSDDAYLTHEVIEIDEDYKGTGLRGFHTKGINNDTADSFITRADRVVGVVKGSIPYGGWVVSYIQQYAILIIVFFSLAVVLYISLNAIFGKKGKKKKAKK